MRHDEADTLSGMDSPRPIRALSDHVVNQIAAGEAIERPASIVKELVENSLDAGASKIEIDISKGGIEHIRVRDNGHGIPPAQLALALARHHTSKLGDSPDLSGLNSLGFRGEALASIGSVADVRIDSRAVGETQAWQVRMPAGAKISPPAPSPRSQGTSVEVYDLFAKVPARRRFLKRPRTEFLHVLQYIKRAGFCYPEVAIKFRQDNREILNLPAVSNPLVSAPRWRKLFGKVFVDNAAVLDCDTQGVKICAWLGAPQYARTSADLQYLAVNRRVVRDQHIAHAIRTAYDSQVDTGRHPAYALCLEVPPQDVDVNVHPGKSEVRFLQARTVHDLVYALVNQAIENDLEGHQAGYASELRQAPAISRIADGGAARRRRTRVARRLITTLRKRC